MAHDRHEWEEPGTYKVAEGVHRIPLPLPNDGLRAVNVYAVEDGDDLVLIDSGWALDQARTRLTAALDEIGAKLGDVRRFLVTHVHRDHYSQAVTLRQEFGTPVALGAEERHSLDVILGPAAAAFGPQVPMLRTCGAGELADELTDLAAQAPPEQTVYEYPDEWISDGADLGLRNRSLRAIATPGHTRGHVVFRDEEAGLLFAGDHVLPHITPSIGFEPAPVELPLNSYLGSLNLVRGMPDTTLLPAHGPVAGSTHRRIDELLEHHSTRLDTTLATITRGADTAFASARSLTWTRHERALDDMDPFNRMLATLETAAHLDLLVTKGTLRAETVDGVRHYAET